MTRSVTEIRALGVVTDVPTAGACFGIGRGLSYDLARRGELPVPVLKVGHRLRVRTSDILKELGYTAEQLEQVGG